MKDIEKALTYYDGNNGMPYCDTVHVALNKQVPSRVISAGNLCWIPACPRCEKSIIGHTALYCEKCGQALDWREDE